MIGKLGNWEMTQKEKEKAARVRWRRKHMTVRKTTLAESRDEIDPLLPYSFGEMMELNFQTIAFGYELQGKKYDIKQRLQRNVVRVVKP